MIVNHNGAPNKMVRHHHKVKKAKALRNVCTASSQGEEDKRGGFNIVGPKVSGSQRFADWTLRHRRAWWRCKGGEGREREREEIMITYSLLEVLPVSLTKASKQTDNGFGGRTSLADRRL